MTIAFPQKKTILQAAGVLIALAAFLLSAFWRLKLVPASKESRLATGPTGLDMIEQDLTDRKIDFETALIYKVQFLFGDDEKLPEKYWSGQLVFEDAGVFVRLMENYGQLSDKTKAILAPYFKRPDDPDSFINRQEQKLAMERARQPEFFRFAEAALAYDRPLSFKGALVTADGKIKIWHPEITVMEDGKQVKQALFDNTAKKIAANLNADKAYTRFKDLLGVEPPPDGALGGDNKTDIYVVAGTSKWVKSKSGSTYGVNVPDPNNKSSFVIVRDNLSDAMLKGTTVHELFHTFQHAFGSAFSAKNWWWIEGTAVWAEDFIYPKLNTEQEYSGTFIPKPEVALYKDGQNHEYGAYVFPFYLSQKYGVGIIKKIFDAARSASALEAADKTIAGGLKANWKEFTLWNYNRAPVNFYKDQSGVFPKRSSDEGANAKMHLYSELGAFILWQDPVAALTAQVAEVSVADEGKKIKKVIFGDLKKFSGQLDKAGVKAVIFPKAKSEPPYIEDWTNKESRAFCLEIAKENFERVVLIFSNGEQSKKTSITRLVVDNRPSCFGISANKTLVITPLFSLSANYKGALDFAADGEMTGPAAKGAKYPYLGKWKVKVKYREKFPPQYIAGQAAVSAMDFNYDHELEFDLGGAGVLKDGTFAVKMTAGQFSTAGWSAKNLLSGKTANVSAGAVALETAAKGVLYELSENGAKIKFPDLQLYNSGGYRNLSEPLVLEIKKD
ncbi:hypothetical protein EPN28_02185 [Patescibacteria group bacterium]|nr:MAG: hypothetical protein EPN28_02185 [Patescibacteria group bacterium]